MSIVARIGFWHLWPVFPKLAQLPFGVAQACDEISGDADCYVEELVRRRATPAGLASSSSR